MSKRTKIILGVVVGVVVVGALTAFIRGRDKDVPRVTTAKAEKIDLVSKVTANGKIQAQRNVDMSAQARGQIVNLAVKEGDHGKQGTRGMIAEAAKDHPVLRGVEDVWGPSDVYEVRSLPDGTTTLVLGQVLQGMKPTDPPVEGKKNDPMMPVAWTRNYSVAEGKSGRAFTATMGSADDLANEDMRRLLVNAGYGAAGLADKIPEKSEGEAAGRGKTFTKGEKQGEQQA